VIFGKYLATAKFSCFDCHSGNMVTNKYDNPEKSWRYFAGGNPHVNERREKIYSANLTPNKEKGIGNWSEEDFLKAVKFGIKKDGTAVRDPMSPFPLLTEKEIKAIYKYLSTLEPA
jgi:mono/diheme cytochrome c family protein